MCLGLNQNQELFSVLNISRWLITSMGLDQGHPAQKLSRCAVPYILEAEYQPCAKKPRLESEPSDQATEPVASITYNLM